jgi:hypothetical protein
MARCASRTAPPFEIFAVGDAVRLEFGPHQITPITDSPVPG